LKNGGNDKDIRLVFCESEQTKAGNFVLSFGGIKVNIKNLTNTLKFIANHPVNKGDKIGAIIRFVKWQIGSRLVPGPVVYSWVNGVRMIIRTGETGLTGSIYCGLHEFEDMSYVLHILDSEDLFLVLIHC